MTAHPANSVFRSITGIAQAQKIMRQVEAVASSIGCQEWTRPEGCDRKDVCWCADAVANVLAIERQS